MKVYALESVLECIKNYVEEHPRTQKRHLIQLLQTKDFFGRDYVLCSKFIEWLKIHKFLRVCNPFYGYLRIGSRMAQWMENPQPTWIDAETIRQVQENYQLLMGLKLVRKMIAEEKGINLYNVCPNYMLEKMAAYQPDSLDKLFKITGFREWKGDTQWHRYIEVIQDWKARAQNNDYQLSA